MLRFKLTICGLCNKYMELFPIHPFSRDVCNFPLNHDAIMRIEFKEPRLVKYQYFSLRSQDSGRISEIILKVCSVRRIEIVSVDNIPIHF